MATIVMPPEVPVGPLAADDVPESLRRQLQELRDRQLPFPQNPMSYGVAIPKIRDYASMEEDGNPVYWDEEFAQKTKFGTLLKPWGDIGGSSSDGPHWMPTWHRNRVVYALDQGMSKMALPEDNSDAYYWRPFIDHGCDEIIDVGGEAFVYKPALLGDTLRRKAELIWGVRKWPRLRLGDGYEFWVGSDVLNQRDEKIAFHAFRQLRYKGAPRPDSASYAHRIAPTVNLQTEAGTKDPFITRRWEDVRVGDDLPPVELHWSWMRCLWACSSTGDYYPWHQEPEFATTRGKRGIFIMQMAIEGIYYRLLTDWGGPETEPRHIKFDILRSICSGDTTITGGRVIGKREAKNPVTQVVEGVVDLHLEIFDTVEDSLAGRCEATVALPRR